MKIKVKVLKEIEIKTVKIEVHVRYDDEDIPNDFPLRKGDMWEAYVDTDTGQVMDWPVGKSGRLKMKVCDEGSYTLYDHNGSIVAKIENNYIPNDLIPGKYGDYIDLNIDSNGLITNWPKRPDASQFFNDDE